MEPSVTVILAVSLGGAFAVAVVSILVAAKRKKAATDQHLDKGPVKRSDGDSSAGAVAPLSLAAGTESWRHGEASTGAHSDSGSSSAASSSDGGGGGGCD